MTSFILSFAFAQALLSVASISGQVQDAQGNPVPDAHVFAEPGIASELLHVVADAQGRFTIDDVAPGPLGLFAYKPGLAFGGQHVNVAVADNLTALVLRLGPAGTLTAAVQDTAKKAVEGARVTRVALLEGEKVAIPLAKLKAFGIDEPSSDAAGNVSIPNLPQGALVALKVAHPRYAQEGVNDLRVGGAPATVTIHPGVLLEGEVFAPAKNAPVSGATVVVQNAQPPHDSAITTTGGDGVFNMRLKPGVYLAEARSNLGRSAGWERITITGQEMTARARLMIAGSGQIRGSLKDAVSGKPIDGARIALETNGNRAGVVRTGPTGEFAFDAASGENIVRFEAAPGYLPPPNTAVTVQVKEGSTIELPGYWLKPLSALRLQVVDEKMAPVPGAVVSLLRPFQFAWIVADAQGWASLNVGTITGDGEVVGVAEHPSMKRIGLFKLSASNGEPARVQLFETGSVTGEVTGARGKAIEGATVGAIFPGESAKDALLLWRTVADAEGQFRWPLVAPGVPQRCVARVGEAYGESVVFNLAPQESKGLGHIEIETSSRNSSLLGTKLEWRGLSQVGGPAVQQESGHLVIYCPASQQELVLSGAKTVAQVLASRNMQLIVVINGARAIAEAPVPVLNGAPPADATTYVLDRQDSVRFECFGLPPLAALQE